jgi:aryl-alcohol dehydrogenase-like predicted oxidoreductase
MRKADANACFQMLGRGESAVEEDEDEEVMSFRCRCGSYYLTLPWLIARPGVTAPIASATSVAQVENLVRSAALELSDADMARLNAASQP